MYIETFFLKEMFLFVAFLLWNFIEGERKTSLTGMVRGPHALRMGVGTRGAVRWAKLDGDEITDVAVQAKTSEWLQQRVHKFVRWSCIDQC